MNLLTKNLVLASVHSGYNQPELRRFGIASDGKLWINLKNDDPYYYGRSAWSDDLGESWNIETSNTNAENNPAIFVGPDDIPHLSTTNASYISSPMYRKWSEVGGWPADITVDTLKSLSQVVVPSSNVPHVFYRDSAGEYRNLISVKKKTGESFDNKISATVEDGYQIDMFGACLAADDNIYIVCIISLIGDAGTKKYIGFYLNTNSYEFSSITTLDSIIGENFYYPTIHKVNNDVWATWSRSGLAPYPLASQVRIAIFSGGSWGSTITVTNESKTSGDVWAAGYDGLAYLVYRRTAAWSGDPDHANLVCKNYNGLTWSNEILLTQEVGHQLYPQIIIQGTLLHVAWEKYNSETGLYDYYYGYTELSTPEPDLRISSNDISFSEDPVRKYHSTNIYANIHNDGDAVAENICVKFYEGFPWNGGSQINGDQTTDVPIDGTSIVSVSWTPLSDGSNVIYISVDAEGEDETAYTLIDVIFDPQEYYVSKSGSDGNGGTSWVDSWLTVQHAVDNVFSGDTITIGPGNYSEQVNPPSFIEEVLVTGPDMETNTIFDNIFSVQLTSIKCEGSGNYTTWKNLAIAYIVKLTSSVHDINFRNILFKEGSSGTTHDISVNNILFQNCVAYNLAGTNAGFRSLSGKIEVKECIAFNCYIGIVTGDSSYNCAYGCNTNFDGDPGTGSIEGDPDFCDSISDDFRLMITSVCLDAGESNTNIGIYQGDGMRFIFSRKGPQNLGCNVGLSFGYTPYDGYGRIPLGDYGED